MIDPVTGLPDLTSDVYQIPLNTDSIPYDDLQAESRLPRQPLFPDDIIPTIALVTGLRSDNRGEVVHTDDNHAAKVYVVNQAASGGGGGGNSSGIDFTTLTSMENGHAIRRVNTYIGVGPLGTTSQKLYRIIIGWTLDTLVGTPDIANSTVEWKLGSETVGDPLARVAFQTIAYMPGPPDIISPPFNHVYDFPGGLPLSNAVSSPGDRVWVGVLSGMGVLNVAIYAWYGD